MSADGRSREEQPTTVQDFLVPDLGEGLADATITSWQVSVGDEITLNQPLCTVETNKAEVEIPSPYTGRVAELGGGAGQTLAVGSVLVRIETADTAPRRPVLVGYGADDAMDSSRRRSTGQAAGPQTGGRPRRRARPARRLGSRRHRDSRRRARRGRPGTRAGLGGDRGAAGDGAPNGVVA